jgi:hypothetical protein
VPNKEQNFCDGKWIVRKMRAAMGDGDTEDMMIELILSDRRVMDSGAIDGSLFNRSYIITAK